jgi:hypothetical protein
MSPNYMFVKLMLACWLERKEGEKSDPQWTYKLWERGKIKQNSQSQAPKVNKYTPQNYQRFQIQDIRAKY